MVGMTPWGVFFLACKLPYTKCWLLCQQAHRDQKWGKVEGQHFSGCCLSAFPHGTRGKLVCLKPPVYTGG